MLKFLLIAAGLFYLFRNYISINVNIGGGNKTKVNQDKSAPKKDVSGYTDYEEIK